MHDDGRSSRWRMKLSSARALLALLIVVPLIAGASLALNWYLLRERQALQHQVAEMQIRLDKQAQTTVRLSNLEQYLSRNDPDNLSRLVTAGLPEADSAEDPVFSPPPSSYVIPTSAANAEPAPAVSQAEGSEAPVAQGAAAEVAEAEADPAEAEVDEELQELLAEAENTDPENVAELGDGLVAGERYPEILTEEPVDTGMVRLENLSARQVGARSLRISFDLYNNGRQSQLSGITTFDLVLPDSRVYPLGSQGDTNYRINNMKRISGNPTLPPEVTETSNAQIRINVFEENELVFRRLVPLQQ